MLLLAIIVILSYLIGSIPNSILISRAAGGIDIRNHGSGNAGGTNVMRVLGWKYGLLVIMLDALKGSIAVILIARLYFGPLPFENISPFDQNFDQEAYYLNFPIHLHCSQSEFSYLILENLDEKFSSRYADKVTSVLLTGTTALTRATADRMEKFGNLYPGKKIQSWFENSDIRHISSETPFYDDCPPPNPVQKSLVFCSHPKYVELFSFLQVDFKIGRAHV